MNFTSSAYNQTSGVLLTGRLLSVWENRVWVSNRKERTRAKYKGHPAYVVRRPRCTYGTIENTDGTMYLYSRDDERAILTFNVHMQVLNVAQLTTTLRYHVTLSSLSRVCVEHIMSRSRTEVHVAVVSWDVSPTITMHPVHRRQRTYSSVDHCLILYVGYLADQYVWFTSALVMSTTSYKNISFHWLSNRNVSRHWHNRHAT